MRVVPPIPVDGMHPCLPDEDCFFHTFLLPIWFLCWESISSQSIVQFLLMTWAVNADLWISMRDSLLLTLVYFTSKSSIILLILQLSSPKSPPSLTYVYHGTIFAWDGVNYCCYVLDRSFVLWMDQKWTKCLVRSYCSGCPMSSEHPLHHLRHPPHVCMVWLP